MTLRRTTTFLIAITLLVSLFIFWTLTRWVLNQHFSELESMIVREDLHRLHQGIDDMLRRLGIQTRDYAIWDDTYQFAQNPSDSDYIKTNTAWLTLSNIGVEHFLILDSLGNKVFHYGIDLEKEGKKRELSTTLYESLKSELSIFPGPEDPPISFLISSSNEAYLVSVDVIKKTDFSFSNKSWLVFACRLREYHLNQLKAQIRMDLQIITNYDSLQNARLLERLGPTAQSDGIYERKEPLMVHGEKRSAGYLMAGRGEGILFMITRSRLIEHYGEKSLRFLLFSLSGMVMILLFILFVVFERLILTPLEKLEKHFLAIRESGDLFIRMPISGPREVQNLSRAINRMLEQFQISQQHLLESEHRFRTLAGELKTNHQFTSQLVNFLPDPTFAMDSRGKIVAWNRAMEDLTKTESASMTGRSISHVEELIYGISQPLLIESFYQANLGESAFPERKIDSNGAIQYEEYVPNLQGGCFLDQTAISLKDEEGRFLGALQTIRNITSQKRAEMRLEFLSLHDPLTGLFNRTYFEEALTSLSMEDNLPMGIVVIDLDGLKLVNDTLGHDHGDALLISAANLLKKSFVDFPVARIGGDEFVVLFFQTGEKFIQDTIDLLHQYLNEYNDSKPPLPVELSTGYAWTDSLQSLSQLIKEADSKMYREKDKRRESVRINYVHNLQTRFEEMHRKDRNMTARLMDLVKRFGEYLELDGTTLDSIHLLAKYRDIGKVGLANRVMMKSGALEKEELTEIQKQPEIGYRIAKISRDLTGIADLILKHREWYNGKGYPLGISGEKIPLENRIVAVVEAYVAMTSPRYRARSMSSEEALQEVRSMSGKKLDPRLVDQFCDFLKQ